MRISVVIPTYNRKTPLERALNSVFSQTLEPLEVIVVDDGSSDGSADLVRRTFPQATYIYQENAGVSAARNTAIRLANGEWLAFLDSDDEWLPGKLEAQSQAIQEQAECRLCHTEEIWIRNGTRVNAMKKHSKRGGHIYQHCLPLCAISPSSAMIRADLFKDIGLFDETLPACEDYDLWLRICAREAVCFVESPQIKKYGGHEDQLSRQHWGMDRFRIQALENILHLPELSPDDQIATLKILAKKARIMAQGAEKRGHSDRASHYRQIQSHSELRLQQQQTVPS